jgi:hypothetical protein
MKIFTINFPTSARGQPGIEKRLSTPVPDEHAPYIPPRGNISTWLFAVGGIYHH